MKKENSPFTPGNPVPVELFVGRVKQIDEILRYVKQTASGKQENIFLSGERGIGKSSLAAFLRYLIISRENFLAIHVFLGGVATLEELVRRIFEGILKETNTQTWFSKISGFFGKYIKKVDLFGISVSFNPPQEDLKDLVRNFPESLKNIMESIKDEKKGLFIVLDDINGISKIPEFADWYKSFVDSVATHYEYFPIFITLIGLPEIRDTLSECQPSLMRIFRVVDIEKLSDEEVEEFFEKAFKKVNIKVEAEAMTFIIKFSSGLPILMHEVGDAVFWKDDDGIIDEDDAMGGVLEAAERIGKKYLDPKVYRAIRSERYRSILRKIGEGFTTSFRKEEIEKKLNKDEKKVFNNFLIKMKELGIIVSDREGGRGAYKFVNELYPVYIGMESQNHV
jgi:energy-coupling factor transporter ATP-binding protein EcfA2